MLNKTIFSRPPYKIDLWPRFTIIENESEVSLNSFYDQNICDTQTKGKK